MACPLLPVRVVNHGDSRLRTGTAGMRADLRERWSAGWGPKPSKLIMRVRFPPNFRRMQYLAHGMQAIVEA
jgi:hypothetical protein